MLVTTLVTVSTRLSTLYPAKSVINSLLNAASRTISQSLSDSEFGDPHKPCQLGHDLRYYRLAAFFCTTTVPQPRVAPCPSLSLQESHLPDKSAVLAFRVPPCRPLSLSGSDYEQRRSQVRVLPTRQRNTCKSRSFATVYRVNSYEHR